MNSYCNIENSNMFTNMNSKTNIISIIKVYSLIGPLEDVSLHYDRSIGSELVWPQYFAASGT